MRERETGRERLDMQQVRCGVGSPYQCICLSIRSTRPHRLYDLHPPQSSASMLHPLLALCFALSLSLYLAQREEQGRTEMKGRRRNTVGASQGGPIERIRQGRRVRGTEQRDNSQGHREKILDV